MLYVHSLMGDARPGELDPATINQSVSAQYERIASDAARFHGPYRVEVELQGAIGAGRTGTATIRVLSAAGLALPNLELSLSATGANAVPSTVRTQRERRGGGAGEGDRCGRGAPDCGLRAPGHVAQDLPPDDRRSGRKRTAARLRRVAARVEQ